MNRVKIITFLGILILFSNVAWFFYPSFIFREYSSISNQFTGELAPAPSCAIPDCFFGIDPALLPYYQNRSLLGAFQCLTTPSHLASPVVVPWGRVNDDYCDCPDGSDEPGTSACSQGSFHCAESNATLSSVFVGDGVCDCCDGSDERYNPQAKCTNRCASLGIPALPLPDPAAAVSPHAHQTPELPTAHMTLRVKLLIFLILLFHLAGVAWIVSVVMRTINPQPSLPIRR